MECGDSKSQILKCALGSAGNSRVASRCSTGEASAEGTLEGFDMSHGLPFMQFYPADWIRDTQTINHQTKGAWIDILCQMWIAPEPGVLEWNVRQFTTLLRLNYDESTEQMVADLSRVAEISLRDSDNNHVDSILNATWITIKSRRIIRDWEQLKSRKDSHKRYNDKRTTRKRRGNDHETTHRSQKSEVRSHISEDITPIVPLKGDDLFERFWKAYPNKTGKGAAQRAFKNARIGADVIDGILGALESHKLSERWARDNGQYIPNPATWINQRRWDDEVKLAAVSTEPYVDPARRRLAELAEERRKRGNQRN